MSAEKLLKLFQETNALLEGHFLLSSGLHSPHYVQCARIFEDPKIAEEVVSELAIPFSSKPPEWVVGPAIGGILLAYELARKLSARAAFTERVDGSMTFRRGFFIPPKSRVIVAEDVLTTGGSALEVARLLEEQDVEILGIAALVNRSGVSLRYPTTSLLTLHLVAFRPEDCLLCEAGKPVVKPGSRA